MKIIAGSSSNILAKSIAKATKSDYLKTIISHFEDQELKIQVLGDMHMQEVIIIQSTSKPANNHLMELLLLIDTAKRARAKRIIAVVPYFGYSRQDHQSYNHGPISASLVASLIEAAGASQVLTIDLHSSQIEGFFKLPIQNLSLLEVFKPIFKKYKNCVVVSPDVGGLVRAREVSNFLKVDLAVINKSRDEQNKPHMTQIIGNIAGRNCIIIDDIVDTAGTITKAADLLTANGAKSVDAFVSHGVLSNIAQGLIQNSTINKIYITNTIEFKPVSPKISIIAIDSLLAKYVSSFQPII